MREIMEQVVKQNKKEDINTCKINEKREKRQGGV
jgi:hypothetical protein